MVYKVRLRTEEHFQRNLYFFQTIAKVNQWLMSVLFAHAKIVCKSFEWRIALLQVLHGLVDLIVISIRTELSWICSILIVLFMRIIVALWASVSDWMCLFELDFQSKLTAMNKTFNAVSEWSGFTQNSTMCPPFFLQAAQILTHNHDAFSQTKICIKWLTNNIHFRKR